MPSPDVQAVSSIANRTTASQILLRNSMHRVRHESVGHGCGGVLRAIRGCEAMRHVLNLCDYDGKGTEVVGAPDRLIIGRGVALLEPDEQPKKLFSRL